jgi:TRAP-type transport system small permease protein
MRRLLTRLDRVAAAVEQAAAVALVLAIVAAVLVQVVMRYIFARPNPWTEELSRYFFIWLSLLGASLATKKEAHFLFESAVAVLPPAARVLVRRAVTVLVAVMLLGVVVLGVRLASLARHQRSPALDLPMVWVYAALPVSAALMLLHIGAGKAERSAGEPGWASH